MGRVRKPRPTAENTVPSTGPEKGMKRYQSVYEHHYERWKHRHWDSTTKWMKNNFKTCQNTVWTVCDHMLKTIVNVRNSNVNNTSAQIMRNRIHYMGSV